MPLSSIFISTSMKESVYVRKKKEKKKKGEKKAEKGQTFQRVYAGLFFLRSRLETAKREWNSVSEDENRGASRHAFVSQNRGTILIPAFAKRRGLRRLDDGGELEFRSEPEDIRRFTFRRDEYLTVVLENVKTPRRRATILQR